MRLQGAFVVVVANPNAGTSKRQTLDQLVEGLETLGATVQVFFTSPAPRSAQVLAAGARAMGADLVIAFGGDYTVNQVALGCMGDEPTDISTLMAAYAAGTGNLLIRSFRSVPGVESFVDMCAEAEPRDVDVISYACKDLAGKDHNGILLVALGFGDFSDAIALSSQKWKKRFGPTVYTVNVAAATANFKPHPVTLRSRGEERKATLISGFVFNTVPPKFRPLARSCNADDGRLDFAGLRGQTFPDLLKAAKALISLRPDQSRSFTSWQVPELSIKSERPMLLNLDGDAGPTTHEVHLKVLPRKVRLLIR
jgi:diacylglycerol kinase (ATP)